MEVDLTRTKMNGSKLILGIDPGYGITGYGIIRVEGAKMFCLECGVIQTSAKEEFSIRIKILHIELKKIIKKFKPNLVSIESLFFCNNAKTAIKVGQARGIILLTAILENVPIVEYTPLQVKQAISGYGNADKSQVQQMVKLILGLKTIPRPDDAADALAIAISAANHFNLKL